MLSKIIRVGRHLFFTDNIEFNLQTQLKFVI
jgi:hypothetical protein